MTKGLSYTAEMLYNQLRYEAQVAANNGQDDVAEQKTEQADRVLNELYTIYDGPENSHDSEEDFYVPDYDAKGNHIDAHLPWLY